MNKFFLSAATAVIAFAASTSANAAADFSAVLPAVGFSDAFSTDGATVLDSFNIVLGTSGYLTASVTGVPVEYFANFVGGLYDGATLIKSFTFFETPTTKFGELASTFVVAPGSYTLKFSGATLGAGYAGSATLRAPAVPEPATWAMMIGGLGLAGAAMRRRKTSVSFA